MSPRRPPNPERWAVYLEALALAVEHRGQHAVAKAVGISTPGLAGLLHGRSPQHATERKVASWYAKRPPIPTPSRETVGALLATLLVDLPREHQAAAIEAMRGALDEFRAHHASVRAAIVEGRPPPAPPSEDLGGLPIPVYASLPETADVVDPPPSPERERILASARALFGRRRP